MIQPHFDGETYAPARDHARLTGQLAQVFELMKDGRWRSLFEIASAAHPGGVRLSEASAGARLRDLRKARFGGWFVERRVVRSLAGNPIWEYRLAVDDERGA